LTCWAKFISREVLSSSIRASIKTRLNAYQIAFQKAREFHKPFLEANSAGSLGYALTWLEHYDQAIDWYKTSLASSDLFGARATFRQDARKSLAGPITSSATCKTRSLNLRRRNRLSRLAGLELDRAYWLLSAGTVEFDLGKTFGPPKRT